jgi:hypothetical protein
MINRVNQELKTGLLSVQCEYECMIIDHEGDVIYRSGICVYTFYIYFYLTLISFYKFNS